MGGGREKTGGGGTKAHSQITRSKLHKLVIFHIDLVTLSLSFLR